MSESKKKNEPRNMRWVFTLNNYQDSHIEEFKGLEDEVKWAICGREIAPTTGTPHLQGAIVFVNQVRESYVKKIFQGKAHWDPMSPKATLEDNFNYCSKEDPQFIEIGERPDFDNAGQREKKRWHAIAAAAKAGDWDTLLTTYPDAMILHYKGLENIQNKFGERKEKLSPTKPLSERFWWVYGPAGTGKSRRAFERFPADETYNKALNKWWDGYEGQPHVVLDDISNEDKFMGHLLKTWCDYQPIRAEVKGGTQFIRPAFITVTSNWHPREIWTDSKMYEPICRRFDIQYIGPSEHEFREPQPGTIPGFTPPPRLERSNAILPRSTTFHVQRLSIPLPRVLTQLAEEEEEPTRPATPLPDTQELPTVAPPEPGSKECPFVIE